MEKGDASGSRRHPHHAPAAAAAVAAAQAGRIGRRWMRPLHTCHAAHPHPHTHRHICTHENPMKVHACSCAHAGAVAASLRRTALVRATPTTPTAANTRKVERRAVMHSRSTKEARGGTAQHTHSTRAQKQNHKKSVKPVRFEPLTFAIHSLRLDHFATRGQARRGPNATLVKRKRHSERSHASSTQSARHTATRLPRAPKGQHAEHRQCALSRTPLSLAPRT
jgi:hypothetical protein